jgi:hypothetical protein
MYETCWVAPGRRRRRLKRRQSSSRLHDMLRLHALGCARPRPVFAVARARTTICSSMPFKPHLLRSSGFFSTTGTAPSHLPPPSGNFTSPGHPELRADVSDSLDSNRGTVLDVDGSFAFVEDMPFLPLGAVVLFERSGVHGTERPRTIPQHALLAAFFFSFSSVFNMRIPFRRPGDENFQGIHHDWRTWSYLCDYEW